MSPGLGPPRQLSSWPVMEQSHLQVRKRGTQDENEESACSLGGHPSLLLLLLMVSFPTTCLTLEKFIQSSV